MIFSRIYREEYAAIFKRGSVAGSLEIAMTFVFRQVYKRSQTIILNVRGLLAGNRNTDGSFNNQGSNANFWSSLASGGSAWNRNLNSGNATVNRNTNNQANGFSVRCSKNWITILKAWMIEKFYLICSKLIIRPAAINAGRGAR
jgi:hypothetical protein